MTVPVQVDGGFTHGTPAVLFEAPYYFGFPGRNYDVAPDGRFLMLKSVGRLDSEAPSSDITVVLNWRQVSHWFDQ